MFVQPCLNLTLERVRTIGPAQNRLIQLLCMGSRGVGSYSHVAILSVLSLSVVDFADIGFCAIESVVIHELR